MADQPIDRGQVCFIAEHYPTNEKDEWGNTKTKSRYAQVGRCALWPAKQPGQPPQVQIELDSAPVAGGSGPIRLFLFWNSEKQQQPQGYGNQQPPQQQYQQPQGYGNQQPQQPQQPQHQQYQQPQQGYGSQRR